MKQIRQTPVVFVLFGICGFLVMGLLQQLIGISNGFPSTLLLIATFGVSGSISWWVYCHRSSRWWLVAGISAGILNMPLQCEADICWVVYVLKSPAFTFEEIIELFGQMPLRFPLMSIFAGMSGAYACQLFLHKPTPVSSQTETET